MSFSPKLFSKTKYHLNYVPKYAREYFKLFNWKQKPKILDIGTEIIMKFNGYFDFIFSCNTLMYFSDIRQAFHNVSQMLSRNGELFFIFAKKADVHDFYKSMSRIEKWAPYMKEFENWNNYFDVENPTGLLKAELERVGIEVLKSEEIDLTLEDEEKQNYVDVYDSLDFISEKIPESDIIQYKEDYHKMMLPKFIDVRTSDNRMKCELDFVVVAARKKSTY